MIHLLNYQIYCMRSTGQRYPTKQQVVNSLGANEVCGTHAFTLIYSASWEQSIAHVQKSTNISHKLNLLRGSHFVTDLTIQISTDSNIWISAFHHRFANVFVSLVLLFSLWCALSHGRLWRRGALTDLLLTRVLPVLFVFSPCLPWGFRDVWMQFYGWTWSLLRHCF